MDVRAATGPSGQASIPEGGGGMTRLKDLINLDELSMKICPNCRVPGVCNERDLRCDFQKAIRELKVLHHIEPVPRKKSRKAYFRRYAKANAKRRAELERKRYHEGGRERKLARYHAKKNRAEVNV